MADIIKYAVYHDWLVPQAAGNIKISPLDYLEHCFGGAGGIEIVDLGQPAGHGTNVGFGMKVLKDGSQLPHSIICLKLADGASGQTPPNGLTNNAIEDAIQALTAWGGYEITDTDALALATVLFPAGQFTDPTTSVTYDVSAPKLVSGILKRDITEAV